MHRKTAPKSGKTKPADARRAQNQNLRQAASIYGCCVLGHLQRGGAPTTLDRLLGTQFGLKAVQLIAEGKFASMVSYQNNEVLDGPIADAVYRLRRVDSNHQLVKTARKISIRFGD